MNAIGNVTRLQLNRRFATFIVPLFVVGAVTLGFIIFLAAVYRFAPGETIRGSTSIANAIMPFLLALGVQSVVTSYPLARAFGAGRRGYVWGTAAYFGIVAAYMTVLTAVLLGLELLTDHWFIGVHMIDVSYLGGGNLAILVPVAFVGALFALALGAMLGTVWMRFGTSGVWVVVVGLLLVISGVLWLAAPHLLDLLAALTVWRVLLVLVGLTLALFAVTATLIRNVSIRSA